MEGLPRRSGRGAGRRAACHVACVLPQCARATIPSLSGYAMRCERLCAYVRCRAARASNGQSGDTECRALLLWIQAERPAWLVSHMVTPLRGATAILHAVEQWASAFVAAYWCPRYNS